MRPESELDASRLNHIIHNIVIYVKDAVQIGCVVRVIEA
jgi:hypothetical protein